MWIKYKGNEFAVDLDDTESITGFCEITGLQYFKEVMGEQHTVFYNPKQYRVRHIKGIPILMFIGDTRTPEQPLNASNYKMLFAGNSRLESIDLTAWDFTGVTDIYRMFFMCTGLKRCEAHFAGILRMSSVFEGCTSLVSVDTQNWDLHNTIDITACFKGCTSLRMLDMLNCDVHNMRWIDEMCCNCENLESFEATNWNTASLISAQSTFEGCIRLKYVDINNWDLQRARSIQKFFAMCESMYYLAWDGLEVYGLSARCKIKGVFDGCRAQVTRELRKPSSLQDTVSLSAF